MLKRFKSVRKMLIASVAACMLLAGGTSAFAAVVNETEPNDNVPLATNVNVGDTGVGVISNSDIDTWKFTATSTKTQSMMFISQGYVTGKAIAVIDVTNPFEYNYIYAAPYIHPSAGGVYVSFNTIAGHQYALLITADGPTAEPYHFILYP
ncbi:hypothetical protein [Paenibacillus contaminans]|uniref:Uncharacterized protein n=1 Tax=Paenibacillus contaminans TaxID=450362 RepID=A0A329MHH7_9BACL|nr:hypothetical protein [Paenibacillus contaminans]RAV18816.1 hypothetical protein DQG23_24105 [Paenibacillus contaminans]